MLQVGGERGGAERARRAERAPRGADDVDVRAAAHEHVDELGARARAHGEDERRQPVGGGRVEVGAVVADERRRERRVAGRDRRLGHPFAATARSSSTSASAHACISAMYIRATSVRSGATLCKSSASGDVVGDRREVDAEVADERAGREGEVVHLGELHGLASAARGELRDLSRGTTILRGRLTSSARATADDLG